ncbi:PhzF family phenazine biosynthesis protein [Agrobacterium rhizogenes]|nr:PhzF family phenazine biosynthesis protein [Rhizobium rhizogenes]
MDVFAREPVPGNRMAMVADADDLAVTKMKMLRFARWTSILPERLSIKPHRR